MLELILVRHGETDSNKKATYLGWTDVELNENGIRQAHCAKEKLKGQKVDRLVCSPLKRTRKTAEIINENFDLEIEYIDSLKERNFGLWDDLPHAVIMERYPEEYELWTRDWKNYCVEGGESSIMAYDRITSYIDPLVKNQNDKTILVVTHLGCIRKIIAHLLGMGLDGSWRFKLDNCSITKLQINDEKYAYMTLLNG